MAKYEFDKLQRASFVLLTIWRDGEVIGNITLPDGDSDITKWEEIIRGMNG